MYLDAVMDEVAARLGEIAGLRVYSWPPGSVTPPAAVVGYPTTYRYDATYGRGQDTMSLPVVVVVGRPTDRPSRDQLAQYVAGSGPASVKTVLEGGSWSACGEVTVTGAEFDVYTLGGTDYLAAIFDLDIAGPGSQ